MASRIALIVAIPVLSLLLSLTVARSVEAQALEVTLDEDYVSNSPAADNDIVVTIQDLERNLSSGGQNDTIAFDLWVMNNLTGQGFYLAATETATEGLFTATFFVTSTTSSPPRIRASDGDHIRVDYTVVGGLTFRARTPSGGTLVIVDGQGPTVENNSPLYSFSTTTTQSVLLQAEVFDTGSGVGTTAGEVESNVVINVDGTGFVPVAADLGGGRWRVSAVLTLSPGSHDWSVIAQDVLGNTTGQSVQALSARLDQDFVSNTNAAGEDNGVTITIADSARNTISGAVETIPGSAVEVKNLTSGVSISLAPTETGVDTGVFTAALNVISTASTATAIQASDGDQIEVVYTTVGGAAVTAWTPTGNRSVTVDATGPAVENNVPPYSFSSTTQSIVFQAELLDAGVGIGSTRTEVGISVAITIDGTAFSPVVADLSGGRWRVSADMVLAAGSHTWSVSARDLLGNTTGAPMPTQVVSARLDQDFVSNTNASGEDNGVTITIADSARNTISGAVETIPGSAVEVKNLTSGVSISLAPTETGVDTGVFTATFSVTSANSTDTSIQAFNGDQIQVLYTTGGALQLVALTPSGSTWASVDAIGPSIASISPADGTRSRFATQIFRADVSDAASGIGTTDATVRPNISFTVEGQSLPVTLAPNADATVWIAYVQTTFLFPGAKTWQVRATDVLGNVTVTDADPEAAGDQVFTVTLDITAPGLAGATNVVGGSRASTGDVADTSVAPVVIRAANDRKSIRAGFNEALDGASVNADGSDFLVLLDGIAQTVVRADHYLDIPEDIFLTLERELPVGATPVLRIIREITDLAGNPTVTGEVTALDGITSGLGVAVTGEAWDPGSGTITRNARNSIHVTFGAALDPSTLQESDFLVDAVAPIGLVFPNLNVGVFGNNAGIDLRDDVFLTLGYDLTPDARPTVEIVGSIEDLAGGQLALAQVTASSGIDPAGDLSVTKTASQGLVYVGQDITYNITVANSGPETSTAVTLTDPLGAGLTFVSATSTQGACSESGGTVTCDLGNLGVAASATVTIVANVSSIANTVSVSSDILDPNTANNAATETTLLGIPAGLVSASQWALVGLAIAFGVLLALARLRSARAGA